jgi:hypothetical protein
MLDCVSNLYYAHTGDHHSEVFRFRGVCLEGGMGVSDDYGVPLFEALEKVLIAPFK